MFLCGSSSEGERQYANSVRTNLAALVADVLALDVKAVGLVVGRHGEFFGRPRGDEGDVWVGLMLSLVQRSRRCQRERRIASCPVGRSRLLAPHQPQLVWRNAAVASPQAVAKNTNTTILEYGFWD